jgi:hypothetical protein
MAEETKGPKRDASGRFVSKAKPDKAEPRSRKKKAADAAPENGEETEGGGKALRKGSGAAPENETPMERVERLARGDLKEGEWVEDISDTVAPSVGPKSVMFHHPVEEPDHDISRDAMGNDKRRQVVGQSYGPSFARQATLYGIFLAIAVALVIGGKIAIDHFDRAPASNPDAAPWSAPSANTHAPPKFVDVGSDKPENPTSLKR